MKNIGLTLHLLVVVTLASIFVDGAFHGKDHDEHAGMEKRKCGKGLRLVLNSSVTMAIDECNRMQIQDFACLISCVLQELKLTKGGQWQDAAARKAFEGLTDNSELDYMETMDKFWIGMRGCLVAFEEDGKKFPTNFTTNGCAQINFLITCVNNLMRCPAL